MDDDKDIRDFLKRSLMSNCFEVDTAEDGEEGLDQVLANEYDLVILDNKMPKKSGLSLCSEIRKEGICTPILVLSVLDEPLTKAELLNIGADDYLSKPFSLEELLARVKALLRREKVLKEDVITLGDLVINKSEHSVSRNGKNVYLTNKEFMLLEFLARNRNKVITRGQLLEHAWDMNADLFSNAIEVHISKIRTKLKKLGQKKIIVTISGRGYKVKSD